MTPSQKWLLVGDAAEVADELMAKFPDAVITSGRRSLGGEAHAVAVNTLKDLDYVAETYAESPVKDAVVAWLAESTRPLDLESCAAGLLAVLEGFTDEEIAQFSVHPSGMALDVAPGPLAQAEFLAGEAKARGGLFLQKEGNRVIWHWQANLKPPLSAASA